MFGECVQCWDWVTRIGLARQPQGTYKLPIREGFRNLNDLLPVCAAISSLNKSSIITQ